MGMRASVSGDGSGCVTASGQWSSLDYYKTSLGILEGYNSWSNMLAAESLNQFDNNIICKVLRIQHSFIETNVISIEMFIHIIKFVY